MTAVLVVNDGVALAGTLALPPTETPCRGGVVMVGGSGPADRDNDWLFPPIRQHLVNAGIAVFSYDKRGVGEATGSWLTSTLEDLAADCAAALTFLRRQLPGEADAVGLFGHSEGAWVVLRAATDRDDLPLSSPTAGQPPPPRGRTVTHSRRPCERATCLKPTSARR
jgi:alpha-beta hydrolase superfamily lysophospholipase